jgi:hypothetical protein
MSHRHSAGGPPLTEVQAFIERLAGRPCKTVTELRGPPLRTAPQFWAIYGPSPRQVDAVVSLEAELAIGLSAALSLLPRAAPAVQQALQKDIWDEILSENLGEVFNILAHLVRLTGLEGCGLQSHGRILPEHLRLPSGQPLRLTYRVEIPGFTAGTLSLWRILSP